MTENEKKERVKNSTGIISSIAGGFSTGAIPIEITASYTYKTSDKYKEIDIQVGHPDSIGLHIGDDVYFINKGTAKVFLERALKLTD